MGKNWSADAQHYAPTESAARPQGSGGSVELPACTRGRHKLECVMPEAGLFTRCPISALVPEFSCTSAVCCRLFESVRALRVAMRVVEYILPMGGRK